MDTKKMKGALSSSMLAETEAVQNKKVTDTTADRFEQAEAFFEDNLPTLPSSKADSKTQVRDSFTFPLEDHELIEKIINRCLKQAVSVNKSETLRAALRLLHSLSDEELIKAFSGIERIKTGRPPKGGA
ncbi:hypothetical protein [Merismopedia glauca]|uniref:Uncharacterized protein n=1 Tax=Merismopedia glauca CCAP 1448/3 TaxID=1296344 RepID=A0A2T1C4C9_9CYAN|nr:hypothetical protein [Merismopedia glauca]PSB03116.1 hypothetical protein C7B64_09900 [Merismopedia glauca CCAP 1448/3]